MGKWKKNHLHFLLKFLTRVSVIPNAMFSFYLECRTTQTWWTVTLWITTLRFWIMIEIYKRLLTKAEERPTQNQEDSKKSVWPLRNEKMKQEKNHLHFLLKFLTRVSVIPNAMFSFYLERRTTQTWWTVTLWITTLRFWIMTDITAMLIH